MPLVACPDPNCSWTFASEADRDGHVRSVHPGVDPESTGTADPSPTLEPKVGLFRCGEVGCGAVFTTKQGLAGHHYAKHRRRATSRAPAKVRSVGADEVVCAVPGCGRTFRSTLALGVHRARTHAKPEPVAAEEPEDEEPEDDERLERGVVLLSEDADALLETLGSIVLEYPDGGTLHVGDLTKKQRRIVGLYDRLVE